MTEQPARYRLRPNEEIEAVQWTGSNADTLRAFCGPDFDTIDPEDRAEDPDQDAQLLSDASHWVGMKPGDWVLKHVDHFTATSDEAFRAVWEPAAVSSPPPDQTALRDRIAAAMREHHLCTNRDEADADGNMPCRCGDWREPGPMGSDEDDWDSHLADVALGVMSPPDQTTVDRIADVLAEADGWKWAPGFKAMSPAYQGYQERAAAVLAVLPLTDRAAVLREAADRYATLVDQNEAYELAEHGEIDHESRLQFEAVRDVVTGLRRLAAEARQPCDGCGHPEHPAHECPVTLYGERCACDEPVAAEAQQQPDTETPWMSDGARIGRALIWSWSEVGRGEFARGYRAAQEEARRLLAGPSGAAVVPVQPAAADTDEEAGA